MATTATKLLRRILDEPALVRAVQTLPAVQLDALVRALGIEDAGELLAMVSAEQFVDLVDQSLWTAKGDTEAFDDRRFPVWLDVLFEGGDELVYRRLRELPEETLVLAFSGQLFVLDVETFGMGMAGASAHEAELVGKALDACLYLELGDYTLVARHSTGWDAVISALLVLDQRDHALTTRVLDACSVASTEIIDDQGGLFEVLSAAETLAEDALADREGRRAAQGFVSRADAIAFLRGAGELPADGQLPERDPISAAYFRELDTEAAQRETAPDASLAALLEELGDELGQTRSPAAAIPERSHEQLRAALSALPTELARRRHMELAYLANLLVAADLGLSPLSAAQEAVTVCARGLARLEADGRDPVEIVRTCACDQLFRLGYRAEDPATSS